MQEDVKTHWTYSRTTCVMLNNETCAALRGERRRLVQFTVCPRWPVWLNPSRAPDSLRLPLRLSQQLNQSRWADRQLTFLQDKPEPSRQINSSPFFTFFLFQKTSPACQQLPWSFCADTCDSSQWSDLKRTLPGLYNPTLKFSGENFTISLLTFPSSMLLSILPI